jgi:hypothetical protein
MRIASTPEPEGARCVGGARRVQIGNWRADDAQLIPLRPPEARLLRADPSLVPRDNNSCDEPLAFEPVLPRVRDYHSLAGDAGSISLRRDRAGRDRRSVALSKPRRVDGYLGLVSSESFTGETVNRGGITNAANGRARPILVEAAGSYPFLHAFAARSTPSPSGASHRCGRASPYRGSHGAWPTCRDRHRLGRDPPPYSAPTQLGADRRPCGRLRDDQVNRDRQLRLTAERSARRVGAVPGRSHGRWRATRLPQPAG